MARKTVLILGGGIGGLVTADALKRKIGPEHRVVIVDKSARHAYAPSFLWLMTGDRKPEQITRPLRQLVGSGIELIQSDVRQVEADKRQVVTGNSRLDYDYLVVALGAELGPETVPGSDSEVHTFYTLEGTIKLRDALRKFSGGKVAIVVSALPYKCPGAPHEAAMLLADFFRRQHKTATVDLFTPEPQPMPVAGPELGEALMGLLKEKGVGFHAKHKLTAISPQARELHFEGREPFGYDLLIVIPPHHGHRSLTEAGLANEAGWVPVDRATLATKKENVFALGDVTALPIPGRWKPEVPLMLPKAGVFAHAQALVVAHRIAATINGLSEKEEFGGDGYCMLEAGGSLAGFAAGNFFATPSPDVRLRQLGRTWHLGKVLMEKWWLSPPGMRRNLFQLSLKLGSKLYKVPAPF